MSMTTQNGKRESGSSSPVRSLRLELLGGFCLFRRGRPAAVPMTEQRVIAYLAVHDRPLLRNYVASVLWLDSSEKHALGNLRSAIWRLQGLVPGIVTTTRTHVGLGPGTDVDIRQMALLATEVLDGSSTVDPTDVDEASLQGELLPGWYDEWVITERERVRQIQLHGLEALCALLLGKGNFARAVQAGLAAVSAEPLRESAQRLLIQAYMAEGNPTEAVRQFDRYRTLLSMELGMEPSPSIKRMITGGPLLSTA